MIAVRVLYNIYVGIKQNTRRKTILMIKHIFIEIDLFSFLQYE